MWEVPYLWAMKVVPTIWNALPPYSFGDFGLELGYVLAAVGVLATLLLGPVPLISLVVVKGGTLREEAMIVEKSCWEKLQLKESV